MKKLLFLLMLISSHCFATTYYVSNSGNDANNGTSTATPFKTLSKAFNVAAVAGDNILFNRGETFTTSSGFNVSRSGSAGNPITYGNYGTGVLPIITSTGGTIGALFNVTGQYVVFDGLNITDATISATDRTVQSKIQYVFQCSGANETFKNCDISLIGIGVAVDGGNATITHNYFHNLRMVRNTPTSQNSNDDYGANPLVVGSSNNQVTYNTFIDCYAQSYDYGLDGGSVEMFGNCNNNFIAYNYSYNCNGFMEFGGGTSSNNIAAYNLMVNCGLLTWVNGSGSFASTVNNLQYLNNTIVSTSADFQQQNAVFSHSGSTTTGELVLKNNIFYISRSMNIASSFNGAGLVHANNLFILSGGASAGFTLAASDKTSANPFTSIAGTDASLWDYHLPSGSPAIDFGINLGLTQDKDGNSIVGNPDAGCYESGGVVIPPTPCTSWVYSAWSTCANNAQVRTAIGSPSGCVGTPDSPLTRTCTAPQCTFIYGAWGACNGTTQSRSFTKSPAGCTGNPPTDSISRACTIPCTVKYGAWGTCNAGIQTRTYTVNPIGCTDVPADSISRTCVVVGNPNPCDYIKYNPKRKGNWPATSLYYDCSVSDGTVLVYNDASILVLTLKFKRYGQWINVGSLPAGNYVAVLQAPSFPTSTNPNPLYFTR